MHKTRTHRNDVIVDIIEVFNPLKPNFWFCGVFNFFVVVLQQTVPKCQWFQFSSLFLLIWQRTHTHPNRLQMARKPTYSYFCNYRLIVSVCFIVKCDIEHKTSSSCSKAILTPYVQPGGPRGPCPPAIFKISGHFVLWEALSKKKYCCSPKTRNIALPP